MEHPENSGEYKGLVVNAGIEQPSSVNPYLKRKPKKRQLSVAEYVEGIIKGDVTILSRAVTLVESVKPEHQAIAQEVIEKCLPYSGDPFVSVSVGCREPVRVRLLMCSDCMCWRNTGGNWLYWLSTSSERSKGSILGDKTRMEKLSVHPSLSSVPALRQAHWEGWHVRRVRQSYFARLPDLIRYSLKR